MQGMAGIYVEISARVSGFFLEFGGTCHLFLDDLNIRKNNRTL
jgi:hypothetical protein